MVQLFGSINTTLQVFYLIPMTFSQLFVYIPLSFKICQIMFIECLTMFVANSFAKTSYAQLHTHLFPLLYTRTY